ncbi:MAG: metallophosphoesterase [Suipraeoptans sp.]
MSACHKVFVKKYVRVIVIVIYSFFAMSLLTSFIWTAICIKHIAYVWFGSVLYIILTIIIVDAISLLLIYIIKVDQKKLVSKKLFVTVGTICIVIVLTLSVYGTVNGNIIRTTHYDVSIDKDAKNIDTLKIVFVADLHLGYNKGIRQMTQMVDKINMQNPDIVMIGGDIFDNEFDAIANPDQVAKVLSSIDSKYGTYACLGNHDISEKILAGFTFKSDEPKEASDEMYQFIEDSGMLLLQDKGTMIDDSFYLYGRADAERPGRGISVRAAPNEITEDIDKNIPIIILEHEPRESQELADAGADLQLAGHTHDGQMFPGNLTIHLFWDNPYGLTEYDNMTNITTSGVGVFGPNMRVGTKSEITVIDVSFK